MAVAYFAFVSLVFLVGLSAPIPTLTFCITASLIPLAFLTRDPHVGTHPLTKMAAAYFAFVSLVFLVGRVGLSAPIPTLTITSPDGDIVECINIRDQPAFRHPLLRDHEIQTPSNFPTTKNEDTIGWQTWHGSGLCCPEGTVPIRQVNKSTGSEAGVEATTGHEYAIASLNSPPPKIFGTKATMNVWSPKVEQVDEFSLGQIWLVAGSYNNNDLNSIEAGWQVYPGLYKDYQPRFFIFWTADAYTFTRCYNLRCPGFVQTSRTVLIEGAISPTSTFGGHQTELTIRIWKDPYPGPWWLGVGLNNGTTLAPVGYWPVEIFTRLTDHAEMVQWGGEIVNKNLSGWHTTTQMGSGYFPGNIKAAYMRELEIAANIHEFKPVSDLGVGETNSTYYSILKYTNQSFAYGGPLYGGAIGGRLDYVVIYLCFGIFLFF